MFLTLRSYLKKILEEPSRARRIVALFLFEFTVVLLGVLAAQALQSANEARRERQLAEETRTSMSEELAQLATTLAVSLRGAPCVYRTLERTLKAIDDPSIGAVEGLPLPLLLTPRLADWSDERRALMERVYGADLVGLHGRLVSVTGFIAENQRDMERNFAPIRLLRRSFGPLSPTDRTAVRRSIVHAMQNNTFLSANAAAVTRELRTLGFRPAEAQLAAASRSGMLCADQLTIPHPAEREG